MHLKCQYRTAQKSFFLAKDVEKKHRYGLAETGGRHYIPRMMQFCVLGSGSGGNATIVKAGDTVLMVDAGFSAARLRDKMKTAGVEPDDLDAILLTHEHGDHMKGVHQLTKKHAVRVYATRHTAMCVQEKAPDAPWTYFEKGQSFKIGSIVITPFATYHDAVDPVGFKFETEHSSLGFISDTGQAPNSVVEYLSLVDSLVVESNYDPDMLAATTSRPWPLKQRIASSHGHLSNEQACDLLRQIAHQDLKNVVLAHLSAESNSPALAEELMRATLCDMGLVSTSLFCASQDDCLPWIPVC